MRSFSQVHRHRLLPTARGLVVFGGTGTPASLPISSEPRARPSPPESDLHSGAVRWPVGVTLVWSTGWQVTAWGPKCVFVNKVLLAHSHPDCSVWLLHASRAELSSCGRLEEQCGPGAGTSWASPSFPAPAKAPLLSPGCLLESPGNSDPPCWVSSWHRCSRGWSREMPSSLWWESPCPAGSLALGVGL